MKAALAILLASAALACGQNRVTVYATAHPDVDAARHFSTLPVSLLDSTVAWWTYSTDGAGTYRDLWTNRYDAAQSTSGYRPAWSNAAGGCYRFDGSDDRIENPNAAVVGPRSTWSVVAWVLCSSAGAYTVVYGEGDSAGGSASLLWFGVGAGGVNAYMEMRDAAFVGFSFESSVSINDGVWHQVVWQRLGANSWAVWVDGVRTAGPATTLASPTTNLSTTGCIRRAGVIQYHFGGLIADVRPHNAALDGTAVTNSFNTVAWKYGRSNL